MRRFLVAGFIALSLCAGCGRADGGVSAARAEAPPALPGLEQVEVAAKQFPSFDKYWYRGKAELDRYALEQARYGEIHRGEAVLIFVTEDFLKTKQVKYEGLGDRSDAISVLKLNAYRRFYTGVYPYNVLTSVFAPAASASELPLKVSFSAQEWCGHVFAQLNRRADHFALEERSYFEAEGDRDGKLPIALLEDGLWTRARRDPASLPTGKLQIIPALIYARLDHVPLAPQPAEASLGQAKDGARTYRLVYASGRVLELKIEAAFPHRILAFSETNKPGAPTTRATLTRSILLPYWEKHGAKDGAYRKALGLEW